MAGRKCFLYGWSVVVDAAVKSAGPEEGGLGASSVEQVNELRGVLVRTVVVSESEDAGPGALAYDNAGRWLSAKKLERALDRKGGSCLYSRCMVVATAATVSFNDNRCILRKLLPNTAPEYWSRGV